MTRRKPNKPKTKFEREVEKERQEARKRPILDDDRIKRAHKEYLKDRAETAENADEYGIWRL